MTFNPKQAKQWITTLIEEFVSTDPRNSLQIETNEKVWERPLVGIAKGDDPCFSFFKQDIGRFYWLPEEAFQKGFPGSNPVSSQLSVISWVIPHTRRIKMEHRKAKQIPSERWSRARLFGEAFNNNLRQYVVDELSRSGFKAVSSMLLPDFKEEESLKYGFASSWSERHTAYACGLGTFGLSDGLITSVGKAVRFGSVITDLDIEPTERSYNDPHAYCLFFRDKSCTKCAERCPVDAISEQGHDKVKCKDYIRRVTAPAIQQDYAIEIYACGMCQTGIPCESRIPKSGQSIESETDI